MRCPVCTALLTLQTDCQRCGLTTASIRDAQRTAQRLYRASMQAMGLGRLDAAERCLHTAQRLHRCQTGASLAWLLTLYRSQARIESSLKPAAPASMSNRIGRVIDKLARRRRFRSVK